MKKYILIISSTIQEFFAFRVNFLLWRFRVIINMVISFYLWDSVYLNKTNVLGYEKNSMLTYILLTLILSSIIMSTRAFQIASDINFGQLSNFLIRPINYFKVYFAKDIADKTLNTLFSFFELTFILIVFKPPFIFLMDTNRFFLFITFVLLATVLYFEISILLSFIGFWSHDSWAPRFVFLILVSFLSGSYFPLDILPKFIYLPISFLPFTYLLYFPLKIYLGNMDNHLIIKGLMIIIFWIIVLYLLSKNIWRKGLKVYTSEG